MTIAQETVLRLCFTIFYPRRAQGSGLRAQGSGLRAQGSGLRAQGSGLRAQGSGLRAQGSDVRYDFTRMLILHRKVSEKKIFGGSDLVKNSVISHDMAPQNLILNQPGHRPECTNIFSGVGSKNFDLASMKLKTTVGVAGMVPRQANQPLIDWLLVRSCLFLIDWLID